MKRRMISSKDIEDRKEAIKRRYKQEHRPLRIYIAGPYTPTNCSLHDAPRIVQHNIDRAIEVANKLIEKGHYPFVPHLSHYIHIHYSCSRDYKEWYNEYDLTFLRLWANALFFIDHSKGASRELEIAKELNIPIYYSIEEVPRVDKV